MTGKVRFRRIRTELDQQKGGSHLFELFSQRKITSMKQHHNLLSLRFTAGIDMLQTET